MDTIKSRVSNESSKLLCCRVCLASNVNLFNIYKYQLVDAFTRISGTPVFGDGLPQHMCAYCSTLLLKCAAFQTKCLRSQQLLEDEMVKQKLTMDYIHTIDRPSHKLVTGLTQTKLESIDYIDNLPEEIKNEPIIDNVDIVDINSFIHGDLTSNTKMDDVEINEHKIEIFIDFKDVKQVKGRSKKNATVKKKIKLETLNEDENNEMYANDVNNDTADVKIFESPMKKEKDDKSKKKSSRGLKKKIKEMSQDIDDTDDTKLKVKKRVRKKKGEVTRKFRKAEDDYLPVFDFETFGSTYNVHVVTLTKEEQLAEIEQRKSSANYQNSSHRCGDCGKGFLAECSYRNHRARHSPSAGAHACEICSVRFKMQCRRQEHQDLHRFKFLCRECSFVSRNRLQARKHYDMHAGKTFECQHCGKSFSKSSTYLSHVRLAHPAMNVACDICGETFVGQVGLRLHKTRMHSENMKLQHKCPSCPASFVSEAALNRHTDFGAHAGSACEQCGESCGSEESLAAHVRERHPSEAHRCEECEQTFASAAACALHGRRQHRGQRARAGARPAPRARPRAARAVCERCGRVLPNASLLRYHQRIHQDVKPFACPDCPKTFAAKHARDFHTRTHTGERPFQCPLCSHAFSLKSNLKRHHKAVHLGLRKSLPCDICRRTFTTGSGLRAHVLTRHKGLPWPKRTRRKPNKANVIQ